MSWFPVPPPLLYFCLSNRSGRFRGLTDVDYALYQQIEQTRDKGFYLVLHLFLYYFRYSVKKYTFVAFLKILTFFLSPIDFFLRDLDKGFVQ